MDRLSHFAPEEIFGTALLLIVLLFVAIRPAAVTRQFESPFATPAPGGGAARQLVPDGRATPSPATVLTFQRELRRP